MSLFFRLILALALLLLPAVGRAEEPAAPAPERLAGRLRTAYTQPLSFAPALMRYPLRKDVAAELHAAREAAGSASGDVDALWKAALLAEQGDDSAAAGEWKNVLPLLDAQVKANPKDLGALERQVQALVGAGSAHRAVTAAEKLAAAQPDSWRAQLLRGDAYLCRADFHWRVLAKIARGRKDLPPTSLLQMNSDLAACETAYTRAVALAPAEPAPRGARIALVLGRPVMAAFLPRGALPSGARADLGRVRQDLIELVQRSPGQTAPLWHAGYYFATQPLEQAQLSLPERQALEKGLEAARPAEGERVFLEEARGLWRAAREEWGEARSCFEAALAAAPDRRLAAEWLGMVEAHSADPREKVAARVRARLEARPRVEDWVLLGVLTAPDDRAAAIQAFRKALALDVDHPGARYNLGVLLLQENLASAEARRHLLEAYRTQPEDREAAFAVITTQALDGELRAARSTLQDMLKMPDVDPDLRERIQQTLKELPASK